MLRLLIGLLSVVVLAGCGSIDKKPDTEEQAYLSDEEIFDRMLGSWSVDRTKPDYSQGFSLYTNDGHVVYVGYLDTNCTSPYIVAHGKWKISEGELIIEVTNTSNQSIISVGSVYKDIVLSITDSKATLLSDDGAMQYRVKGIECF